MGNTLYNGVPVEEVGFEEEFDKELALLQSNIEEMLRRKAEKGDKFNYHFWAIKLSRANKAMEMGKVTLDGN